LFVVVESCNCLDGFALAFSTVPPFHQLCYQFPNCVTNCSSLSDLLFVVVESCNCLDGFALAFSTVPPSHQLCYQFPNCVTNCSPLSDLFFVVAESCNCLDGFALAFSTVPPSRQLCYQTPTSLARYSRPSMRNVSWLSSLTRKWFKLALTTGCPSFRGGGAGRIASTSDEIPLMLMTVAMTGDVASAKQERRKRQRKTACHFDCLPIILEQIYR
jgi:hypothetical protein